MNFGRSARAAAAPHRPEDGVGVDDTFLVVVVGTKVCFEAIPAKDTTVPLKSDPRAYNAFVDVLGVQGDARRDRRAVLFLVPPRDPGVH